MNPAPAAAGPGNTWLIFALLTVLSWGVYGVILHKGRGYMPMGSETPIAHALVRLIWMAFGRAGFAVRAGGVSRI